MNYSIEDLFEYSGQYDKVVSLIFASGTESYTKFGDHIVGQFHFTPKEREQLQKNLEEKIKNQTFGCVKFKSTSPPDIGEQHRKELETKGLLTTDIWEILQFNSPMENEFSKTDLRKLPDPMEIEVDLSDVDHEEMFLWTNVQRTKSGYKLIPEEISKHNGIILRKYESKMSAQDLANFKDTDGEIKKDIKYYYLKSKFINDEIDEAGKKELDDLIDMRANAMHDILKVELQKASEKWKQIGLNYKEGLQLVLYIASRFKPRRLTHNKFPIWWDFERFLHIYVRHVSETQIGERFKGKSVFQYALKDIEDLIEIVLERIDNEIQKHFRETPEMDFKRHGELSVYYNGDYYTIHIEKSGRLMNFYKREVTAK